MRTRKILTIIIIFFLLLFIGSNVFASTFIDVNYDYLYEYKINTEEENVKILEERLKKDDRVLSGDFYYFAGYNYGDRIYNAYLIRKTSIDEDITLHFLNWGERTWEGFQFKLSKNDLQSTGDFIHYSGRNGFGKLKDDTSYYSFGFYAQFDSSNKTYTFPLVTNYDKDIAIKLHNGENRFFFQSQTIPIITQVTAIPQMITTTIKKIIPVGLVILSIFLLRYLIRLVILRQT